MKKLLIIGTILIAFFASCEKETIPADDIELGKEYFPITKGHTIEYAIDSVIFNDFKKSTDTFSMEFKDVFGDSFIDNEGRESIIVNRYIREDSTFAWQDLMTYYVTKTNFRVELIENNLRMIKLVFPVKLKTAWNGNAYISGEIDADLNWLYNWNYQYISINKPFNNGRKVFENALEVTEIDEKTNDPDIYPTSYATKTYAKEVYAKNIGLIYREITNWEYQENVKYRSGFSVIFRATKSY